MRQVNWAYMKVWIYFLCLFFLGFWHEQSRADRDNHVTIVWDNINPSMKYNFMKYTLSQITHLNAPYDTCSVMHYNAYAFSKVISYHILKLV